MEDDEGLMKTSVPPSKAPVVKKPPERKDVSLPDLLETLQISGEDTLFFMQLPDTLPGQPPTQDSRPVRTEVQTEDGHMLLVKDKGQVCRTVDSHAHIKPSFPPINVPMQDGRVDMFLQ